MDVSVFVVPVGKLALAAVLGGVIGFERETKGQFAGFRTTLLIGIGSCLMMMLSLHMPEMFEKLGADSVLRIDPARIAAYAIASMGFLGGGAIIKGRGSVRGLTTAASLWLVTGLGLAVGAGYYLPSIVCTAISMVALCWLGKIKALLPQRQFITLSVGCACGPDILERLRDILGRHKSASILFVNFHQWAETGRVKYVLRLSIVGEFPWKDVVDEIMAMDEALDLSWIESDVP